MSLLQLMGGQNIVAKLLAENCKLSVVDGTAFFWPDTDISAYAGTEGSATGYMVHVWNDGKVAIGYLGAAGAAETLGADVVVNGTFAVDDNWDKGAGWTIGDGVATGTAATSSLQTLLPPLTVGALYKTTYDLTRTDGGCTILVGSTGTGTLRTTNDTFVEYLTCETNGHVYLSGSSNFTGTVDNVIAEPLTDCPATALHIVSAKNGSTHNWKYIDSGFNYNATTYNVQIMKAR